jgi:hypothetical protein
VPASLIQDQHRVHGWLTLTRDLLQKDRHGVGIDDATRLAHVEVLPDEARRSTTALLVRALRCFRTRGIRAQRVMTGTGYVARLFRKALRFLGKRLVSN